MDILEPIRRCFTIIFLSLKLFTYLGLDYRWISKLLALILYTLFLLPGIIQVAFYYFFTNRGPVSVEYGYQPRNWFDVYLPSNIGRGDPKPVLIFVTGGAWIIGNKAWGSLLAMQFAEKGIIVVCLDYRNFPQGTISDMIRDVSEGIAFVCNNINIPGGDRNRIYLMGHSAGAHISACALVRQAIREANGEDISWRPSTNIRAFFGLSGGYNMEDLVLRFHARGLYSSIFLRIMEGVDSLQEFSPKSLVHNHGIGHFLPHVYLYHGTSDSSIPDDESRGFCQAVLSTGGLADIHMFLGRTHTDYFLQDSLRGGSYEVFELLLEIIQEDDPEALAMDAFAPPFRRLVPDFLLKLASKVCPF